MSFLPPAEPPLLCHWPCLKTSIRLLAKTFLGFSVFSVILSNVVQVGLINIWYATMLAFISGVALLSVGWNR